MKKEQSVQRVTRNLKDAGCSPGTIEEFLALDECGKKEEQLRLLDRQRSKLLERVHREEKRIDCLDYLVYQMNRKEKAEQEMEEEKWN